MEGWGLGAGFASLCLLLGIGVGFDSVVSWVGSRWAAFLGSVVGLDGCGASRFAWWLGGVGR